jgi:hypothetical protein
MSFLAYIGCNMLVDWWLERLFILPFASLHLSELAEQVVAPNRSLPPSLNSTSSVRGSED